MKMRIAALALLASALSAHAQTPSFYVLKDSAATTFNVGTYTFGGKIFPLSVSADGSGNPMAGLIGTSNPNGTALYVQGVTGGVALPTLITGSLPSFASPQHFVCDSGCGGGISATFGAAIGTLGTPGGFKDGSGNFQSFLGDVTNGQWVSIRASVALPVTGTFFQATQPVSIASMPSTPVTGTFWPYTLGQQVNGASVPVVLTAAQLTTLTPPAAITGFALDTSVATTNTDLGPPGATACATDNGSCSLNALMQRNNQRSTSIVTALGTPFQAGGSIGNTTFAATQATASALNATVVGTGTFAVQASIASASSWGVNTLGSTTAGQSGELALGAVTTAAPTYTTAQSNALSLTTGGALRVDGSGVTQPVSLTSTTITGSVTVQQGTGTNLHMVCDSGCSSSTSPSFGATFPLVGTPVGMSQGGNLVAMTGTSGNLNVQCANCSGSGVSTADAAAFTAGSSLFAGGGGFFQTTATSNPLTTGQQGMFQLTANRALFTNIRNASGAELGLTAAPFIVAGAGVAGTPAGGVVSIQGVASGTVVPVSLASTTITGTVAATQSGTWNVTNISGTVSLPTGAATAALQPTNAALASTTAGQTGHLMLGAVTTGAPAYTTAQSNALSLTTAGALRVDGSAVTQPVSLTSTTITGTVAVTQSGAWSLSANQSVNVAQINGVTPLMGNGVTGTGSQRVTIASDNTAFAVNATLQASSATAIGTVNPTTAANWGLGATGSAVPANAAYVGMNVAGNLVAPTGIATGATVKAMTVAIVDASGNQITAFSGSGGTSSNFGSAFPTAGTAAGFSDGTNMVSGRVVAALSDALTNSTPALASGALNMMYNGTTWDRVRGDTTNGIWVNVKSSLGVANGATISGLTGSIIMCNTTTALTGGANGTANYLNCTPAGALRNDLSTVAGSAIALGQTTMAASLPVAIASNQSSLPVTPAATESHLGEIGSNQIQVTAAPTVTASAYSAGNAIGGLQTLAGAARVSGSLGASGTGGILTAMMVQVKSAQSTQVDVFLFNANPSGSTCTDKTAFVLAAADASKVIGVLSVPATAANGAGWYSGGTGSLGMPNYYPITYDLASATSVFACAVARGAFTPASTSDVQFAYNFLRN